VYALIKKFPREEQYALCDQLRRAAVSIPSNIAEGMGRVSDKEKAHFLEIAYGSLMEVECQLDIALKLNYITENEYLEIDKESVELERLLSGLHSSVRKKNFKLSTLNFKLKIARRKKTLNFPL
jgi:four helix bundle protein